MNATPYGQTLAIPNALATPRGNGQRVVVAMSGGVDSSVAGVILAEAGWDVIGMTLRTHSSEVGKRCGRCCGPEDIDDARAVAQHLGIPFYVIQAEERFTRAVVNPFVEAYSRGRTPIPCSVCNSELKFGYLLDRARRLGAKLATGHYARIQEGADHFRLLVGRDEAKDQSYFLYELSQMQLRDLLFPVGALTKSEVRSVAERYRLPVANKPESMEICFVPDGDYARFVEQKGGAQPPGKVVDVAGKVVGEHQGIHHFTVGQRRGLGIGGGERMYVHEIDATTNQVVVAPISLAERSKFLLTLDHWVRGSPPVGRSTTVRVRHRHVGVSARIASEGGQLAVALQQPVRGVSPGQAAVFYDGDEVLGGGTIDLRPPASRRN